MAAYFDAPLPEFDAPRSYNVAPTDDIVAVVQVAGRCEEGDAARRRLEMFQWGLVPSWAKDPRIGNRMINARAETAATKNAFRSAFRRRRCIVPADGFYEWPRVAPGRGSAQRRDMRHGSRDSRNSKDSRTGDGGAMGGAAARPMPRYIYRADGQPLAMAGLWEHWPASGTTRRRAAAGSADTAAASAPPVLRTASVLTTAANEFMAPFHDRMPVLLPRSAWEEWLDPCNHDTDALATLCRPAPDGTLASHAVSRAVGNVGNCDASLIEPAVRDTLF